MFASLILLKDFAEISRVSLSPGRSELVQVLASFLYFQVRENELTCLECCPVIITCRMASEYALEVEEAGVHKN
jgi:hypothetical protein